MIFARLLALLLVLTAGPLTAHPAWVADEIGETPDPAIVYGELPNGLRFAIRHNAAPRGVAVIEYRVGVGVQQEGPRETEYAHFVEHLDFGSTASFPKGDAIEVLQAAGMQIGRDVGGTTTAKGTFYSLSVPAVSPDRLALALRFMRGLSDGPSFDPNEVERQKGVIAAELAGGENQKARAGRALAAEVFPELPFLYRDPAARIASVRAAAAAGLRAFHDRWYRPDNAFLVIVGDVDPAATATAIEAGFATWQRPATPLPPPPRFAFTARHAVAAVVVESGLGETVGVAVAQPNPDLVPTPASLRRQVLTMIGLGLVSERVDRQLLSGADLPITTIHIGAQAWPGTAAFYDTGATVRAGRWREALALIERETRRPLTATGNGGFTGPEVDRAVTTLLKSARAASDRAAARTSDKIASGIVSAYGDRTAFVLPERNFERIAAVVNAATPADILAAYRASWTAGPPAILLTGATVLAPAATEIVAAYAAAQTAPIAASDLTLVAAKQLPLPGPAGKVVDTRRVDDLDTTLIRFGNGVRLNLKHTDFRAGEVVAALRLGGGILALPGGARPAAPPVGTIVFGGAGGLDFQTLEAGLRGHQVSPVVTIGEGVIGASSTTNPGDLPDQLRLWAALFGAPTYDGRADSLLRAQLEAAISQIDATPQAAFGRRWNRFIHGDPRFAPLEPTDLDKMTMAAARSTWSPLLTDAPIELTIVGDMDPAAMTAAAARTLGALPARRAEPLRAAAPPITLPTGGTPVGWTHRGDPGRAIVVSVWPAPDGFDLKTRPAMQAIAAVLQSRVFNELRQTAGATYTPTSLFEASDDIRGFGYTGIAVEVAAKDVPLAERTLRTIAASLAGTGPGDDEFTRVMAPLLARAALGPRTNEWWLANLDWAQTRSDALEWTRTHETLLKALKVEQVRRLAARIFAAPAIMVRVLPAVAATAK